MRLNFNPRSYKRSDSTPRALEKVLYRISIHAPTRGATLLLIFALATAIISIHAPTRGATRRVICPSSWILYFNPRSYKRSDRKNDTRLNKGLYFNPRSYKRSDFNVDILTLQTIISIHAPTRGATHISLLRRKKPMISIHAPTRGATF